MRRIYVQAVIEVPDDFRDDDDVADLFTEDARVDGGRLIFAVAEAFAAQVIVCD